jgi:alpha-glucosidase
LHLFDSGQPDFDWRNPEVPAYFEQVLRYWFELGVDGFRIDVAHGLLKAAGLPDFDPEVDAASPMVNQPEVHDVYRAWRSIAESYRPDRDVVFVAEAWAPTARDYAAFVRPDELHQAFYFDLLMQPWDAGCFRTSVQRGLDALAETAGSDPASVGVFAWTLNNHDVFRAVTRYGIVERAPPRSLSRQASAVRPLGTVDVELGTARARAAALFLLGLPGSVYLYQGEELGLPEVLDLPDDRRQDPIWAKSGGADPGRDGCRVPLPWTSDEDGFGFSLVRTATSPWLPQPDSFGPLAASAQAADPNSMLTLYRDALRVRRRLLAVAPREHEWLEVGDRDDVVAYARGPLTVVTNFGGEPFSLPRAWGKPLLATVRAAGAMLPGNSGAWLATG